MKVRKNTMNKANFRFKRNISKELSPVIKKYTQLLYKKGLSDNTITHYRCHINRLATFCNVEPDKLTIKNFDKYIEYITFVKQYSPDYINQLISSAYLYYTYILKIKFNKELYSRRKKKNKLHHYLTYEEFILIGKQINDFRTKVIMWLCYDAGLRAQEAINITLDCLDFDTMTIKIIDSKNNKSRLAKMSPMIHKYLTTYINKYRPFENRPNSNYLFRSFDKNRPIYYSNVEERFRTAVNQAGLGNLHISLHTLRHAYVTMLYENGVAPDHIQKVMGHCSISTTMNYIVQSPSFMDSLPSHHSPTTKK